MAGGREERATARPGQFCPAGHRFDTPALEYVGCLGKERSGLVLSVGSWVFWGILITIMVMVLRGTARRTPDNLAAGSLAFPP